MPDCDSQLVTDLLEGLATQERQQAAIVALDRIRAALESGSSPTPQSIQDLLFQILIGPLPVRERLTGLQLLEDQAGSGGVLSFDFAAAVDLAWVRSVGVVSRAGTPTAVPTATKGIYCADDEPTPVTLYGTQLRVFAPAGATVSVWGFGP